MSRSTNPAGGKSHHFIFQSFQTDTVFCHRNPQIFQMCCYWWHSRLCGFPHILFIPSLSSLTTAKITTVSSLSITCLQSYVSLTKLIYVLCVYCECVCLLSRMWVLWLVIFDFFFICNIVTCGTTLHLQL